MSTFAELQNIIEEAVNLIGEMDVNFNVCFAHDHNKFIIDSDSVTQEEEAEILKKLEEDFDSLMKWAIKAKAELPPPRMALD